MTMSEASVSSTLQCWVTVSSPRHIVTSTAPKEWMVHPAPTLMATVLVFLKGFSRRRAEMESVAPLKPFRTPVAIFGSLAVCIYGLAGRHWLISYSPIHLT